MNFMEARDSQFAIRMLPSLTDFAFLMPILYLFGRMGGMQTLLSDCDTGWHIRTGQWIARNHMIPMRDLFSFAKPDGVWYAWEWISDLLFAWLNAHGGLAAVTLFAILIISITFALVFRLARRNSNAIVAILFTTIAAASSSIHWLVRPHLFTLLFLVLFYSALERVRAGQSKYLLALPAATVVWTNLHGGFLVGIVIIAAYGAGELLKMALDPNSATRREASQAARRYFLCAVACLAASVVNPYTYRLHLHMVEYLRDPYASQHIQEFLSVSFHHPIAIFFESLLLLGAGVVFWSFRRRSYVEAVLIVVFAHGALLAARNIPLYSVVAAPAIAAMLAEWLAAFPQFNTAAWLRGAARKFNSASAELTETDRIGRWHVVSVAGIAIVAALLFAPHPPKAFRPEFDPKNYPAAAIDRISRDALGRSVSARIFTSDQWGDYLIYRLYPRIRVFIDGRSDFYGAAFEQKAVDALNVKDGWEDTLARFSVDTVLLPPGTPLSGALKISRSWRLIYDDGVALVFRSATAQSAETAIAADANNPISSIPAMDRGKTRDREVTKTEASDPAIAKPQSTT
jgi:hypothetical protein